MSDLNSGKSKDPAALIYIDTWLSSTAEMDADCRGWYLNLILHQFDKGSLPDDVEKIAQLASVRFSEFGRFKQVFEQVLKQKFSKCDDGRLRNEMADRIITSRKQFTEKRSKSGAIGFIVKTAISIGFKEPEIAKLKSDIYSNTVSLDEAKDKQVLKHLLKLYINGDGDGDKNKDGNGKGVGKPRKDSEPKIPTLGQMIDYFTANGYPEALAKYVFGYYEKIRDGKGSVWKDTNGNTVKDWKAKMRVVWFKDENKVKFSDKPKLDPLDYKRNVAY